MGDIGGMAEKIQSFFLQEVLSQTHLVLKDMVQEVLALIFSFFPWLINLNPNIQFISYSFLCA